MERKTSIGTDSMLKRHFLELLAYTQWANTRLLDALTKITPPISRAHELAGHLILSQKIWLDRVNNRDEQQSFWADKTTEELKALSDGSLENWRKLISEFGQNDFERRVRYVNTKGVPYENSIAQILGHVINHSSHHRAQAVQLIRQQGHEPPVTDYIVFARE